MVKTASTTSRYLLHNTRQPIRQNFYCTKAVVNEDNNAKVSEETATEEVGKVDESGADFRALVELEVELYRQEGFNVPDVISEEQWRELLTKTSRKGRRKYLAFLWKNQIKQENKKKKKEMMRLKREEEERQRAERKAEIGEEEDGEHIRYGLWLNSIFLYVRDSTINNFYHSRLISAMIHGQPLVLDLDFDAVMSNRERQNCAFQLQVSVGLLPNLLSDPTLYIFTYPHNAMYTYNTSW